VDGSHSSDIAPAKAEKPGWVEILLKQAEIASAHVVAQHDRMQKEIYERLKARSDIVNYTIAATIGLGTIIGTLFPENLRKNLIEEKNGLHELMIISCIFFIFSFAHIVRVSFISNTGHIYAAAMRIERDLPRHMEKIEGELTAALARLGALGLSEMCNYADLFSWERHLRARRQDGQLPTPTSRPALC